MRLFKYLIRELLNNKRFSLLFLLNLSMGLAGFIALDGFKISLDQTIKKKSKGILGADFGLSARRPITEKEQSLVSQSIDSAFQKSYMVEMFSMVANKQGNSRLIQVKAIEESYPFYGKIELQDYGLINKNTHLELREKKGAWVYPEILQQLKVKIGDTLRIGEADFFIQGIIEHDSAAGVSTSMAPRLYINLKNLEATKLLRPGSLAWHSYVYKLEGYSGADLANLRDQVFQLLDNPDVRVYTHENASTQMARMLSRLNDFLGLTSLVALFLAALGSGFLFRAYFKRRLKQMAILICLGSTHQSAFVYYITQIALLGFVSSLIAILLAFLLVPGLGSLTQGVLPFPIEFILRPSTLSLGVVMGTLGSLLICLPSLIELRNLKPSLLLVEQHSGQLKLGWKSILASIPALLLFWGLAIWLSHSFFIGTLFSSIFLGAGGILGLLAWSLFKRLSFQNIQSLSFRWALRDLTRHRLTTLACFVSIGLGTLLLNLIPQLQRSLNQELTVPGQSKLPSLFMFDIQEEQVTQLRQILGEAQTQATQISPIIRSRLLKVNDEDFDHGKGANAKTLSREEEREARFRNRGFNLSYRLKPIASEEVVKGQAFSGPYVESGQQLPQISLEQRFAKRLNLKIGDKLTFDIESIPVEGRVVNLRSVRWTSFQPNFFIQFQPGVLELAPKTFIATMPALSKDKKLFLQDRIVEKLPNVSLIDVSHLVGRMSRILEQMTWALAFMSFLCLLAGFVVIYSIANHQAMARKWDIGLLKALGAPFKIIRAQFLLQFSLISLFASSLGAGISLLVSFLISKLLFENLWAFDAVTPLLSILGCVLITFLITDFSTRGALKMKTRELFSS